MASSSQIAAPGSLTRAAYALAHLAERLDALRGRRRERHRIMRELNAHTDRELHELGMSRDDIPEIARGAWRR